MIKDIKYNGFTQVPSDYECPDGDIAGAVNVIPEDGSIHGVFPPSSIMSLSAGQKVWFIHKTSAYTHYIIYDGGTLYWMNGKDVPDNKVVIEDRDGLGSLNAVGNMLMALCDDGIYYYFWKKDKYVSLGNHLPNIEISFGLQGNPRFASVSGSEPKREDRFIKMKWDYIKDSVSNGVYTFSDDKQSDITASVMAKVNKFVREQGVDKGRFVLPFLVRYALRLYDDSLVCHSAPILMHPSTAGPMVFNMDEINGKEFVSVQIDHDKSPRNDIMVVSAALDYMLVEDADGDYAKIKPGGSWSEIVKSIDVFVSKPIYTYDQNGLCKEYVRANDIQNRFVGAIKARNALSIKTYSSIYADSQDDKIGAEEDILIGPVHYKDWSIDRIIGASGNDAGLLSFYTEWDYRDLYRLYRATTSGRDYPSFCIKLPELDEGSMDETIRNTSVFYKLCSIKPDKLLSTQRTVIEVGDDYLQSLVNRESMTDDYLTHDAVIAGFSQAYNQRINLSGLRRRLFRGFLPESMLAYKERTVFQYTEKASDSGSTSSVLSFTEPSAGRKMSITTYVEEGGHTFGVTAEGVLPLADFTNNTTAWGGYLYYPNVNAKRMIVTDGNGKYSVTLGKHEFLNGAFSYTSGRVRRNSSSTIVPPDVTDTTNIVDISSKVYTSEVQNPLYFPLSGINTVGTGSVMAVCSAVKALSQGQFGEFPLYAFTDEGVWAMHLSNTGTYSAVQPVTRDVCINPESITQMDSAVLFATDRGIMMLEGSNTVCISDVLMNSRAVGLSGMPYSEKLLSESGLTAELAEYVPFMEFIAGCRMIYDYTNQRIIVYNPDKRYAYVYSLKDKAWGMMASTFTDTVNAYPDAYAMTDDGTLVNVSSTGSAISVVRGMFWTRPIKLDYPDALKTIDTVIQRGVFRKGHVRQVLYGSRNLFDWFLIHSSNDQYLRGFRGTPYKYFKLCLIVDLEKDESLYGCTIQYTPRYTNQPR